MHSIRPWSFQDFLPVLVRVEMRAVRMDTDFSVTWVKNLGFLTHLNEMHVLQNRSHLFEDAFALVTEFAPEFVNSVLQACFARWTRTKTPR
jgi:hypothetical protein